MKNIPHLSGVCLGLYYAKKNDENAADSFELNTKI